ncbi:MAG TPA: ethanolamine ammonia-lyase subunit EutC [Anaerolineales bacterium]|nr:ethanolamine ammonia-lyase subunit EutC [Anaerolineales bacterium]
MDEAKINAIIEAVIKELGAAQQGSTPPLAPAAPQPASPAPTASFGVSSPARNLSTSSLTIDLPEPTLPEHRYKPRVKNAKDPEALKALIASTTARIGVGRSGPHYNTFSLLLFQGDHAITQDALMRDVDQKLLDDLGLFTVQTKITGGKQEYLLRPDLGRLLNDEAKKTIQEKCVKSPNIQLVVGDGLSAAAVEANVREMFPVITNGAKQAGLSVGTPFFIKYCRVGVLNDIGELLKPDVVILLIGERPGLGRAESLSAYLAYRPKTGDTDADRDVVCNIFNNGGTNPLEGAAFTIQIAQKMMKHQTSGVKLKLATQ